MKKEKKTSSPKDQEKAAQKAAKADLATAKALAQQQADQQKEQKKLFKAAAKEARKELDKHLSALTKRIRKETKCQLKAVVTNATQELDVSIAQAFDQALQAVLHPTPPVTNDSADSLAALPPSSFAATEPVLELPAAIDAPSAPIARPRTTRPAVAKTSATTPPRRSRTASTPTPPLPTLGESDSVPE